MVDTADAQRYPKHETPEPAVYIDGAMMTLVVPLGRCQYTSIAASVASVSEDDYWCTGVS